MGLNPSIATYWLCDFRQVMSLRLGFLICEMGSLGVADLLWIWMPGSTCTCKELRSVPGRVRALRQHWLLSFLGINLGIQPFPLWTSNQIVPNLSLLPPLKLVVSRPFLPPECGLSPWSISCQPATSVDGSLATPATLYWGPHLCVCICLPLGQPGPAFNLFGKPFQASPNLASLPLQP